MPLDNEYLQDLINECYEREGGFLLNMDGKPAAVVLSLEKYNQLLSLVTKIETVPATEKGGFPKHILVTGGAGYIGAHIVRLLLDQGIRVSVVDNLVSGKRENLDSRATFFEGDIGDTNFLRDVFSSVRFDAVMHLAASLEVEESVRQPEKYLQNNVFATGVLLSVMNECDVKKLIFSSTASVYSDSAPMPLREGSALKPSNPYGYTKLMAEKLVKFYCQYLGFESVIFRYFNACGSGYEGGILPTHNSHLVPIVMEVARGQRQFLKVNGDDYATPDGTCVRDYVHVMDIARAHVAAMKLFEAHLRPENPKVYNIGTGRGVSVREMALAASEILNKIVPMEMGERRDGDPAICVADSDKLKQELGFEFLHSGLESIIQSAWLQNEHQK